MTKPSTHDRKQVADDSIRIVQLLHPGGEHRPGPAGTKPWNSGKHRRTFVHTSGRCLPRLGVEPVDEQLDFWCEWEAEADLIQRIEAPVDEGPKHLFKPRLYTKSSYRGLQNTDPCVFGGFHYCICQQRGVLKKLGRGSVVLFGSCLNSRFVVDTVFVVENFDAYDRNTINDLKVSEAYRAVGLGPLFPNAAN